MYICTQPSFSIHALLFLTPILDFKISVVPYTERYSISIWTFRDSHVYFISRSFIIYNRIRMPLKKQLKNNVENNDKRSLNVYKKHNFILIFLSMFGWIHAKTAHENGVVTIYINYIDKHLYFIYYIKEN